VRHDDEDDDNEDDNDDDDEDEDDEDDDDDGNVLTGSATGAVAPNKGTCGRRSPPLGGATRRK
jgi:hypothetical protein